MIWTWIIIGASMLVNLTLVIVCIGQGGRLQSEREENLRDAHRLMRELDLANTRASQLVDQQKEVEADRDELKRLLNGLNAECDRIDSDNRDLRFIKTEDNKLIEELQDTAESRQRKIEGLEAAKVALEIGDRRLRAIIAQDKTQIENLHDAIDMRRRQIEVMEGNIKALTNENSNRRTLGDRLLSELEAANAKLNEQTAEIEHLIARNEDLSRKLTDQARELDIAKKNAFESIKPMIDSFGTAIKLQETKRQRDQFDQEVAQLRKHVIPALQDNLITREKLLREVTKERDKLTVDLDTLEERFCRFRAHVDGFLASLFLPEMKLTAFQTIAKKIMEAPSTEQTLDEACSI